MDRFLGMVEADPDGAGEAGGIAGEPRVFEVVGGSGLPGGGLVETEAFHRGGGAGTHDFLEDLGNRPSRAGVGGLVGQRRRAIQDISAAILDFGDEEWPVSFAVVGENRV